MSSKISELPSAPYVRDTALLVIVQDGADYKALRSQVLQAKLDGQVEVTAPLGSGLTVHGDGNIELLTSVGKTLQLGNFSDPHIELIAGGIMSLLRGGTSRIHFEYLPANSADWDPDPTELVVAVDRLASAVAALRGSPIP